MDSCTHPNAKVAKLARRLNRRRRRRCRPYELDAALKSSALQATSCAILLHTCALKSHIWPFVFMRSLKSLPAGAPLNRAHARKCSHTMRGRASKLDLKLLVSVSHTELSSSALASRINTNKSNHDVISIRTIERRKEKFVALVGNRAHLLQCCPWQAGHKQCSPTSHAARLH